jgi:hypothetical protein
MLFFIHRRMTTSADCDVADSYRLNHAVGQVAQYQLAIQQSRWLQLLFLWPWKAVKPSCGAEIVEFVLSFHSFAFNCHSDDHMMRFIWLSSYVLSPLLGLWSVQFLLCVHDILDVLPCADQRARFDRISMTGSFLTLSFFMAHLGL